MKIQGVLVGIEKKDYEVNGKKGVSVKLSIRDEEGKILTYKAPNADYEDYLDRMVDAECTVVQDYNTRKPTVQIASIERM